MARGDGDTYGGTSFVIVNIDNVIGPFASIEAALKWLERHPLVGAKVTPIWSPVELAKVERHGG